jgi:hypothetical protein
MIARTLAAVGILCLASFAVFSFAQPPGGAQTKGAAQQAGATPSAASLQGLMWPSATWDTDLTVLPEKPINQVVVACYTLNYGNSSAQPLLLKPAITTEQRKPFEIACKADGSGKLLESNPGIVARCKAARDMINASRKPGAPEISSFSDIKWSPPCANLDSNHPLKMGQTLVIGIDVNGVILTRVKILNLNVTTVAGNPINPTPITASFSNAGTTSTTTLGQGPYFLTWLNQVPGDTIATVNVNAVYTPAVPGEPWQPATIYPVGSVVISPQGDGHYYTATFGGVSAKDATNVPAFRIGVVRQIQDGSAIWLDSGNVAPSGGPGNSIGLWAPGSFFNRGQVVLDPYNGHYFTNLGGSLLCPPGVAAAVACARSGYAPTDPFSLSTFDDGTVEWIDRGTVLPNGIVALPRNPATTYNHFAWVDGGNTHYYQAIQNAPGVPAAGALAFPIAARPTVVTDGSVVWQDAGTTAIAGATVWLPFHPYQLKDVVLSSSGEYYRATTEHGTSGPVPSQPYFGITPQDTLTTETDSAASAGKDADGKPIKMAVKWEDSGTMAPASVAGGATADQTVSLMNLQFAQSHTLSYYNLDSGVVFSFVRSPSFAFSCTTASPPVCTAVQTSNSRIVDPVLLFTVYPVPWDAEAHCPDQFCLTHLKSNPPGFNFGLSLASPASSFYAGGTFELLRNIQLVGGYNFAKESALSATQPTAPTSTTTPATIQKFSYKPFFGITLNVPGLIQQIFGAGASKASTAGH